VAWPTAVRTFASICLARTHPGIQTWAAAISALELEPGSAARAVQTCIAGMTASPLEVITMMRRLADELPSSRPISFAGAERSEEAAEHG